MKRRHFYKLLLGSFALTLFFPLKVYAVVTNTNEYFTIEIGESKSIYAPQKGYGVKDDLLWQNAGSFWGSETDPIVVTSNDNSNRTITVLGLREGTATLMFRHIYYTGNYNTDRNAAWYYAHITVKASNNPKLLLQPTITRTRVPKGTVLNFTSNVSEPSIYYSTEGSVIPGRSSRVSLNKGIILENTTTVRAQAVMKGYPLSDVFMKTYKVIESEFSTTVAGGNIVHFKIVSEENKTCKVVYVPENAQGTLRIPQIIDGYTVTAIDEEAIANSLSLTSVVIPSTITSIGKNAFEGCIGLSSIELPDGLTQLGERAFANCTGLTSITLPSSVVDLGKSVFEGCTSLNEIHFADGQTDISERAFAGCTGITSLDLPNSLKHIGKEAFAGCTGLTSVILPSSIEEFGTAIFKDCTNIQEVTVNEGLVDVGENTFMGCSNLSSVNLPTSLQKIGSSVFSGCQALNSLTIPSGVIEIGAFAFKDCCGLKAITFTDGMEIIKENAFQGCIALESITIPDNVKEIGEYAFAGCSKLESVIIPQNVSFIGENAFASCGNLKFVTINSDIIMSSTYTSSLSLKAIFGEQVEKYVIENQIASIGDYAFSGCENLLSIVLPKTLTHINNGAFMNCSGLISIDLPDSLQSIGSSAFQGCTALTSLLIPEKMAAIGDMAFYGCPAMKIILSDIKDPFIINNNVFTCYDETVTLCVPKGTRDVYWSVSGWIRFNKIVEYTKGDVNVDEEVDVLDVVDIARFVVGKPSDKFLEIIADINRDGSVNIGDAVALVNNIAGEQNFVKNRYLLKDCTTDDNLTLTESDGHLSLNLENARYYTAFQFDLYLPDGTDVKQIKLNVSRMQMHQILFNKVENGHYRVAVLSTSNNTFNEKDGELIKIELAGDIRNKVSIRNILFFDTKCNEYPMQFLDSAVTTNISQKDNGITKIEHTVFDLQGRKCDALKRGFNIVGGKKIILK